MKFLFSALLIIPTLLVSNSINGQVQMRSIEPNHSTIGFSIPVSGITRVTGKFMSFELSMNLVDENHEKSGIIFTIDPSSITTGIPDRDEHLKSEDFFNVEKYKEIRFESTSIDNTGTDTYLMTGNFTMHGTTKTEQIPFRVTGTSGSFIGYEIKYKINRIDYGVGANWEHSSVENFLGDEVDVVINLWTRKAKNK